MTAPSTRPEWCDLIPDAALTVIAGTGRSDLASMATRIVTDEAQSGRNTWLMAGWAEAEAETRIYTALDGNVVSDDQLTVTAGEPPAPMFLQLGAGGDLLPAGPRGRMIVVDTLAEHVDDPNRELDVNARSAATFAKHNRTAVVATVEVDRLSDETLQAVLRAADYVLEFRPGLQPNEVARPEEATLRVLVPRRRDGDELRLRPITWPLFEKSDDGTLIYRDDLGVKL